MISNMHELLNPKGFSAALWPYRFSAMAFGHCNAVSKKFRAIYTVVMVSASLLFSYFVSYNLYKLRIRSRGSDVQVLFTCFGFWMQVICLPMHILLWFFIGNSCYVKVVASLTLVDRELAEISYRNVNLKMTVIRQLFCIILPLLIVTILIMCYLSLKPDLISVWKIFEMTFGHYSGTANIVLISFFGNLVCFVGDRYALINSALKRIGSSVQHESDMNLSSLILDEVILVKKLRIIHRKLFFVSREVMKAFAIQAFTCVLAGFTCTVHDLYVDYKFEVPTSSKWVLFKILIPVIGILYHLAVVIYVAYCCHQTVREANGTTKILNSLTIVSEDLRLEVSSFSYQLMHYQLRFSLLGFFQLDLALLQSMFGSIATYLVILVQMESVQSKSVNNTTAS